MATILKLTLLPFDLSQIPALHKACWPEVPFDQLLDLLSSIVGRCQRGRAWAITALQGGEPVGFGQLSQWTRCAEISDLIVSACHRGQGVGTEIINGLLEIARQQGFREVEIGVAEANARALELYQRMGFEIRRRITVDLGNGLETVLYLGLVLFRQDVA